MASILIVIKILYNSVVTSILIVTYLIRHLKGIRKKCQFRRSDGLCKQVKTLS